MSPYLTAYERYQAQDPDIPWINALDFHLQHGIVHADAECFGMLRPVAQEATDEELAVLTLFPVSPTWHVWVVAGNLKRMLEMAQGHGIERLTFHRRGFRIHRASVAELLKRSDSRDIRASLWESKGC